MAENVVTLGGTSAPRSDRRAEFLRVLADAFDNYVSIYGHEPDGVFISLNAMNGDSTRGWLIAGAAEGYATLLMTMQHIDWAHEIGRGG